MKLHEASRTPPSLRRALQGSVDGTSTSANDSILLIVGSLVLALTVLFYFAFAWFSRKRTSSKGDLESVDHANGIQTPETDDSGWLSTSIDGDDTPGGRTDPKEHRRLPPDKKRIIIEPTKSAEGALQKNSLKAARPIVQDIRFDGSRDRVRSKEVVPSKVSNAKGGFRKLDERSTGVVVGAHRIHSTPETSRTGNVRSLREERYFR